MGFRASLLPRIPSRRGRCRLGRSVHPTPRIPRVSAPHAGTARCGQGAYVPAYPRPLRKTPFRQFSELRASGCFTPYVPGARPPDAGLASRFGGSPESDRADAGVRNRKGGPGGTRTRTRPALQNPLPLTVRGLHSCAPSFLRWVRSRPVLCPFPPPAIFPGGRSPSRTLFSPGLRSALLSALTGRGGSRSLAACPAGDISPTAPSGRPRGCGCRSRRSPPSDTASRSPGRTCACAFRRPR